jgi:hypothetical protein
MNENDKPFELEPAPSDTRPAQERFPSEPFPCPACGQLLAPSCRVCVACKHAIDPAEIRRPRVFSAVGQPAGQAPEPVRFSWRIFLIVFAIWVVGATLVQNRMAPRKAQLVLGGVQILCSLWVLFDALEKRLPRPLRWGMGTLLLWPIIFPWYLARRSRPKQACPFIEARVNPITLAVLFIVLAILFYLVVKHPPPP